MLMPPAATVTSMYPMNGSFIMMSEAMPMSMFNVCPMMVISMVMFTSMWTLSSFAMPATASSKISSGVFCLHPCRSGSTSRTLSSIVIQVLFPLIVDPLSSLIVPDGLAALPPCFT